MEYDYYEDRHRIPEEEHRRIVRNQVAIRSHLRSTNDPFAISSTEFYRLYRMPQHRLLEIAAALRPYMPVKRGSSHIPVELAVLSAVCFYAHGSYQRPHGRSAGLNLSQASVSNCIRDVTTAFNHPAILTHYIHFPVTRQERNRVIQRNSRQGLPNVLGYIDGTLVNIVPPSGPDKHVYRTRKGFTALNVCDSELNILNVNATFPGSANDPYIYRMSPVRALMRAAFNEDPCWLLGDSIYPHEPWLQTPLLHAPPGTPEYRYTRLHCHGRNCVERCIGVLKARWRCLLCDRTLHYKPVKAGMITNACAVLHNFLRKNNADDPVPIFEDLGARDPDEPDLDEEIPNLQRAAEVRQFLIQTAQHRYDMLHEED